MRLCLFCLWLLQAMLLAKKQAHTKPELSATLEAPHSADIKALAAQLDNNPYCIHQWVHDYIRFFPTYGSVQGAQETLAKKSGNAFDTASLLIALLRSASIESRYVYGTVDIPAEQLMNWVGDAKTPDAAQQILGQGGIPNTALTRGGKVVSFRLENTNTALAKLPVGGSVGQEIRNAVQAGKEVTVHEKPVSAFGWTGYGYSIVDPETGAGAYIIEGGGNGGIVYMIGMYLGVRK